MNTNLRSAIVVSIASTFAACGGGENNSSAKQFTVEELKKKLPEVNTALDTSTPAGLWVGDYSYNTSYDSESSYRDWTETGRAIFMILPASFGEDNYLIDICGSTIEQDTRQFSLNGTSLSAEVVDTSAESNDELFSWVMTFTLDDNLAASMEGMMKDVDARSEEQESYRMAAVKISDATFYIDAASEFDISYRAASNEIYTFSDISGQLNCISASTTSIEGTLSGESYSGTIQSAHAEHNTGRIDIDEYDVKGIPDISPGYVGFFLEPEARDGGCGSDNCPEVTTASVNITEQSSTAFSFQATASLDDEAPDIELSFSISAP